MEATAALGEISWVAGTPESCFPPSHVVAALSLTLPLFQCPACRGCGTAYFRVPGKLFLAVLEAQTSQRGRRTFNWRACGRASVASKLQLCVCCVGGSERGWHHGSFNVFGCSAWTKYLWVNDGWCLLATAWLECFDEGRRC